MDGYVIVYSITDRKTFRKAAKLLREIREKEDIERARREGYSRYHGRHRPSSQSASGTSASESCSSSETLVGSKERQTRRRKEEKEEENGERGGREGGEERGGRGGRERRGVERRRSNSKPVIVVANKSDLERCRIVSKEGACGKMHAWVNA